MAQSDFTHADELDVTIAGQPFAHLLYHFVLVYSRWEHVGVVLGGFLPLTRSGWADSGYG